VRHQKWGPRTLDVDLICCFDSGAEVFSHTEELTLPHPYAHQRAFVLVPWVAVDPAAEHTVDGLRRPVREWLDELGPTERDGVRLTGHTLSVRNR
jgi:2-amino-4-hydroxy-6-hydroxymethyldihydropteridine diphosphokinase